MVAIGEIMLPNQHTQRAYDSLESALVFLAAAYLEEHNCDVSEPIENWYADHLRKISL